MNYYPNIETALKAERPNDKIVKILNNKFAIVKSAYDNGTHSHPQICGLDRKTIYFYGDCDKNNDNTFTYLKDYITTKILTMPNHENRLVGYLHLRAYVLKSISNKRYKKNYRKILKFI